MAHGLILDSANEKMILNLTNELLRPIEREKIIMIWLYEDHMWFGHEKLLPLRQKLKLII